jgi:hypothetical protein
MQAYTNSFLAVCSAFHFYSRHAGSGSLSLKANTQELASHINSPTIKNINHKKKTQER